MYKEQRLMRASARGLTSTASRLLALGADIAAKDAMDDDTMQDDEFFQPRSDVGGMTALALACVKVGNMEKLSWGGASADEAPHGLAVGRLVRATVTFTTNTVCVEEVRNKLEEREE